MNFTFIQSHMVGRQEIDLEVTYTVHPGTPARLYGDYPHPEEPMEIEILSVTHGGIPFDLSDEEVEALGDIAFARAVQDWEEYKAEEAEYRAELKRDDLLLDM